MRTTPINARQCGRYANANGWTADTDRLGAKSGTAGIGLIVGIKMLVGSLSGATSAQARSCLTGGKTLLYALLLAGSLVTPSIVAAAVGCSLSDPDRDIKRIFPQSTGYRTAFITLKEKVGQTGADRVLKDVEARLGDKLDPASENIDVPYAFYTVLKGTEVVGVVHGVNQKGTYGGMQVILATDLSGKILDFYYQKISSPEASKFRDKAFTQQFRGLALDDFLLHDGQKRREGARDRIAEIKDPSGKNHEDFLNTLRGIKKNLILLEILMPGKTLQAKPKGRPEKQESQDEEGTGR